MTLRRPHDRRAAAYVFVLGVCLLVTVIGMAAARVASVSNRQTSDGNDWELARSLAFSATEQAISVLNSAAAASPTAWRTSYTSGQVVSTQTLGRGTISWVIKDETDGNLQTDYGRPFRVYGIGRAGSVTRVYSVQAIPAGQPLDVLRTALHSSDAVDLKGNTRAVNGPYSSNGTVKLSGTVNGAVEARATTGNAAGTQTITAPAAVKSMPSPAIFSTLAQSATPIDYASLNNGTMSGKLLSPANNPYGTANSGGVYSVAVPNNKTLTVQNCRIVGTLLVSGTTVRLNCAGPNLWETGPLGTPIVIFSSAGGDVTIAGSGTWLTESGAAANFNPAATPYNGASNATQADDYPPQYRGLIHVIAGSGGQLTLSGNAYVFGTVIADCPVKTGNQTTFVQNPALYANSPMGYEAGDAIAEVPGSWKWDTLP